MVLSHTVAHTAPPALVKLNGLSGAHYRFMKFYQIEKIHKGGNVWLARCRKEHFALKDVSEASFSNFNQNIWPQLRGNPYIRQPCDTIEDRRTFVFKCMENDFRYYVERKLPMPMPAKKRVLRDTLRGIAELHERKIAHLDIMPDNIMVNAQRLSTKEPYSIVDKVQLIDLEDACYMPEGPIVTRKLTGHDDWRSPEAYLRSRVNTSADMFSFGIVCIYAVLGRAVFGVDDDFEYHRLLNELPDLIRMQRHVSYFGDQKGVWGLISQIDNEKKDKWVDNEGQRRMMRMLWSERENQDTPYKPFARWGNIPDEKRFKDLIQGLTNLDPTQRITAQKALEHPWFEDVVD